MKIVKTRKVGNSVVVTLPPELGYEAGIDVLIDRASNGDLRIMPAARLHDVLRERARRGGLSADLRAPHREMSEDRRSSGPISVVPPAMRSRLCLANGPLAHGDRIYMVRHRHLGGDNG